MYTTTKAVDGVIGIPYIPSTPHPLRVLTLLPHPLASGVSSTVAYLSYMPVSAFGSLPFAFTVTMEFAALGRKEDNDTCAILSHMFYTYPPSQWLILSVSPNPLQ